MHVDNIFTVFHWLGLSAEHPYSIVYLLESTVWCHIMYTVNTLCTVYSFIVHCVMSHDVLCYHWVSVHCRSYMQSINMECDVTAYSEHSVSTVDSHHWGSEHSMYIVTWPGTVHTDITQPVYIVTWSGTVHTDITQSVYIVTWSGTVHTDITQSVYIVTWSGTVHTDITQSMYNVTWWQSIQCSVFNVYCDLISHYALFIVYCDMISQHTLNTGRSLYIETSQHTLNTSLQC